MNRKFDFPELQEIPFEFQITSEIHQSHYLLDGNLHKHQGGITECLSPIYLKVNGKNEQVRLGDFPSFSIEDSFNVLQSSVSAYDKGNGRWQKMSFEQRIRLINNFLDRIQVKKEPIVRYLMWETAKNFNESVHEFDRTIEYTRHSITALEKLLAKNCETMSDSGFAAKQGFSPVGVVLCMGPSNYPFYETYSIVLPALLMGNNVILQIPRLGALFHYFILDDLKECFPPGTINTLYGSHDNTVFPVMDSGLIDMLAYFGNSGTASTIIKLHPEPFRLKMLLGLSAKNPAIVLADADLEFAVKEVCLGALAFNGQRCAALKMIFVHKSIFRRFVDSFVEFINKIPIGMPWDTDVRITPLSEPERIEYLKSLIRDAVSKGAVTENPHAGAVNDTMFYPAVLTGIDDSMLIYHEEQFGPIVPIISFDDLSEPLEYVRNSDFGQQVSIFGKNQDEIKLLTEMLKNQVSRINLNSKCQRGPDTFPFSGRKNSGMGVLSIVDTLLSFAERHIISGKEENPANMEFLEKV